MVPKLKKRILFLGIPDMAFICLEACCELGANIVGVMGPKPSHYMYNSFKDFVLKKELNFIEYNDLNSPELLKKIKELNIDMAVVSSFNYKIPPSLLNATKDGFINLHPSLLPKYRGANPYSHVIINNEKITGVTLHYMNEEFDKGDIILQQQCEITKNETMGSLFEKTNQICVQLLVAALEEYEKRRLPCIKQIEGDYPIAPNLSDNDIHIDFNKTAIEIERLVRSINPFIIANAYFRGEFVKVMKVEVIKKKCHKEIKNGTIVDITKDKVLIKTKEDCISISVMQYGSIFAGDSIDFIKFVKPKKGEMFY